MSTQISLVPEIDRGSPGASARREEAAIDAHPHIGKLLLALSEEPQTIRAREQGANGEQALGEALEGLRKEGIGVLHDRRIPGRRANIDHVVIGPAGVFVIDAKRYTGKIVMWPKALYKLVRDEGPLEREQRGELERLLALTLP